MTGTVVGEAYSVLSLAAVVVLVVAARVRQRREPRLTRTRHAVLDAIHELDRPTALAIYQATGYGPGRVYPALDVLLQAEWIAGRTDPGTSADQTSRVVYHVTYRGQRGAGLHTKDHS
ncbi:hypothetical protein [Streptomyces sp. NPDC048385]|uniref:hypothetical protein n=1 Tax=unclassified Streptomyces TaxID=2593676 RepID=UPI003435101D